MKKLIDRKTLLLAQASGILGVIALTAGGAAAQTATPDAQNANSTPEIVVTATKQAVAINKVPISIAAFNQKSLDTRGINTIEDLALQTPGLDVTTGYISAVSQRIAIRGIDSTAGAATTGIYIDDVPIQARTSTLNYAGSTVPQVFDLDRVEVLRGPQGTLFGASAEGGAVRFITPTPSLTTYSVYGKAVLGQVDHGGASGEAGLAVGGPIIEDKLGFRVSYDNRHDGGYVDRTSFATGKTSNDANYSDTSVFHASIVAKPVDWVTLTPSLYYQKLSVNDSSQFWANESDISSGKFRSGFALQEPADDNYILPSLKALVKAGPVDITSVTSYFQRHETETRDETNVIPAIYFGKTYPILANGDVDSEPFYVASKQQDFTQEIRFSNNDPDARLKWQVGAFYSHSRLRAIGELDGFNFNEDTLETYGAPAAALFGGGLLDGRAIYTGSELTIETEKAVFANVDYKILKNLTLTVGGRYAYETLKYDIGQNGVSYGDVETTDQGAEKEKPFTPKVALSWQQSPDNLYYASYSKGFRAGGVNSILPSTCAADLAAFGYSTTPTTYNNDTTENYEIGSKNRLMGGRLAIDASAFYINWNNIQQQVRFGCAFSLVLNSGTAVSKGFDLSVSYRVDHALSVGGSLGYTDANYDKTIQGGDEPVARDGETLGLVPWSVEAWAEYHFEAPGDLPAYFRIQDDYKSQNDGLYGQEIVGSPTYNSGFAPNQAINQLDLRLGATIKGIDFSLFVYNALDASPKLNVQSFPINSLVSESTIRPRFAGLQAIYRY